VINSLDAESVRAPISGLPREQLDSLEVFPEIESTNSYLLDQPAPMPGRFRVALADHQTAGRGRRDRQWQSPGLSGVCLSMSYTFAKKPPMLSCLTLAIGVGVIQSLERLGVRGIGLKWPNDLIARDRKLGGILTEVRPAISDKVTIVTGIGINYDLRNASDPAVLMTGLGAAIDLAAAMRELPSRSLVATILIEGLFNVLADFDAHGFSDFADAWERYDWLRGQRISVDAADRIVTGICQGIDDDGALILQTDAGRQRILSGSIIFHGQKEGRP